MGYYPDLEEISFYFSNEFVATQQSYKRTEGLIGRSFAKQKRINEENVLEIPGYVRTRPSDPPYKAVMCIPVRYANERIGVVTVDKPSETRFKQVAVNVAGALAAQCALGLHHFSKNIDD